MTNEIKTWPMNNHHDHYDARLGWEHLGSDDNHDYYVNHRWECISIVYGAEPWDYLSPDYFSIIASDISFYHRYPYSQLRKLLGVSDAA